MEVIIEHVGKIENMEVSIFLLLLLFTLWFIRNTVKYYQGEKKALKRMYRFAKEGEVQSQYQLAKRYQEGNAVRKSCNQAAFWYQKAAFSGDKKAQEHLKYFLEKRRQQKKC